ncbi:hypothetical protein VKS41_003300 [Umbelopsis sp. WA50703]
MQYSPPNMALATKDSLALESEELASESIVQSLEITNPGSNACISSDQVLDSSNSKEQPVVSSIIEERIVEETTNTPVTVDSDALGTVESEPCSCTLVFASGKSKNCSLCDKPIAALEELRNQSINYMEALDVTKSSLEERQQRIDLQSQHLSRLTLRIEELEESLQVKITELSRLKKDMQALNTKYVSEINRVSDVQHEKDLVEQELEELSRRLFEEANVMVASEKREKWNLEVAYRQLENQLRETQEHLYAEQAQLQELRSRMEEMTLDRQKDEEGMLKVSAIYGDETNVSRPSMEEKIKRISANDPYFRAQVDMARLHGITKETSTASSSSMSLPPTPPSHPSPAPRNEPVNDFNILEFQEFIQAAATTPLKKLHGIPYLKHCLTEDVEPCLRFGPNPKLSARRIADAVLVNPCFIEESFEGYQVPSMPTRNSGSKQTWFSSSSNNAVPGCHACGKAATIVHYRFKLVEADDWSYVDEGCRDRLVAVCEFYVFVRNARLGHYANRTVDDLYSETVRLRLQMFYSRAGALSLMLNRLGLDRGAIGKAAAPDCNVAYDIQPSPVQSLGPTPSSSTNLALDSPTSNHFVSR